MTCGTIFSDDGPGPKDADGCRLPVGHAEPHEFVAADNSVICWETDLTCDCDHCMRAEGDYCMIYWPKAKEGQHEQ